MVTFFHLDILSNEKALFFGDVTSIIIPCENGYVGVLANHAPFISTVVPGKVIIKFGPDKESVVQLDSTGFIEVFKNKATLFLS